MSTIPRAAWAAVIAAALALPAFPAAFSFEGTFFHDNDVQLFNFSLLSPTTVTLETWSYGGGTLANGNTVSPGGFAPELQVFDAPSGDAQGGLIVPGVYPDCAPRNPDPNRAPSCQDAYAQMFLAAGSYYLSLTQAGNDPLGDPVINLSAGFFWLNGPAPDPNFNGGFQTIMGQGTGAWALDILSVDSAGPLTGAPEPGSALLAAAVVLLVGIGARRKRCRLS
jgi:hypothetical protein